MQTSIPGSQPADGFQALISWGEFPAACGEVIHSVRVNSPPLKSNEKNYHGVSMHAAGQFHHELQMNAGNQASSLTGWRGSTNNNPK